jgi:hypothetical protein
LGFGRGGFHSAHENRAEAQAGSNLEKMSFKTMVINEIMASGCFLIRTIHPSRRKSTPVLKARLKSDARPRSWVSFSSFNLFTLHPQTFFAKRSSIPSTEHLSRLRPRRFAGVISLKPQTSCSCHIQLMGVSWGQSIRLINILARLVLSKVLQTYHWSVK